MCLIYSLISMLVTVVGDIATPIPYPYLSKAQFQECWDYAGLSDVVAHLNWMDRADMIPFYTNPKMNCMQKGL